jgi:energy-coupling factor transport system permease protein
MSCRCYTGGEGRTRMKQMKLKIGDILSLVVFIAGVTAVILLNKYAGANVI